MIRNYTYQALIKNDPADEPDYPRAFLIVVPAENDVQAQKYVEKVCPHEYEIDLIAIEDNN